MKPAIEIGMAMAVVSLCVAGCGVTAVVTDFSDGTVQLRHLKTSPLRARIKVIEGDATRVIKLKSIDKLSVFPAGTRSEGGQLYYQAGILLDDGTKLGFADKAGEKWAATYLCIDGELRGKTVGGWYVIPLDKIMELDIQ